ncbi:uncharacterized protein LOC120148146 [Hibiscus syriacus]|uniref:uncharacterized protein LOC120148146 n=1 Tax=Hibiscus syriacus TaxID=106335 RepID=UPI0019232F89|nr:uncharacterized protein LOC120148146 [Hibiscus syriacus]
MADEVMDLMKNLKFTDAEATVVETPLMQEYQVRDEMDTWILAKLLSPKPVVGDTVIKAFKAIWGAKKLVETSCLKPNIFLFKFVVAEDKDNILRRTPWIFNGYFSVLDYINTLKYDPFLGIEEYDFSPLKTRLRVFGLPLGLMNQEMGEKVGNTIGEIVAVDLRKGE